MIGAAIMLFAWWGWHLSVAWRTFAVFLGLLFFLRLLRSCFLFGFLHIDCYELEVFPR